MTNEIKHEIISFRRYSIDLTKYIIFFQNRLETEIPRRFCKEEITEAVNATCWIIRNKSSQSTDSSDNGTT